MPLENTDVQPLAGRLFDNLLGAKARGLLVDVPSKPQAQRIEATLLDLALDLRMRIAGGVEKLRCGHRPKTVEGEIAKSALIPVRILQASDAVVRNLNRERGLHPVAPRVRQLSYG